MCGNNSIHFMVLRRRIDHIRLSYHLKAVEWTHKWENFQDKSYLM